MIVNLGQAIKYCADNRVLAEISYHGTVRVCEVYSFRFSTKNFLLFVYDVNAGHTKSLIVEEIEFCKATLTPFNPRWGIEI